ncbi:hypothetical protein QI600_003635 [Salmonella enterica]|nr:hypothetical protein [Salmonella enterica]
MKSLWNIFPDLVLVVLLAVGFCLNIDGARFFVAVYSDRSAGFWVSGYQRSNGENICASLFIMAILRRDKRSRLSDWRCLAGLVCTGSIYFVVHGNKTGFLSQAR